MKDNESVFNKICGRLCVEISGHLDSPLLISSGKQDETDADAMLAADGTPFIPGSTIAGVLRSYNRELGMEEESDQLFGTKRDGVPGEESDKQSRIFCYDTFLENAKLGIRDGVKLGENKTPNHMSKYELQIIERNATFRMRIEIIEREDCLDEHRNIEQAWMKDMCFIRSWIQGFSAGELRLGAKSRRGFGKLAIESVRIKKFHMEQEDVYLKWLDWDWEQEDAFGDAEYIDVKSDMCEEIRRTEHVLEVPLSIPYTLLIRTYNTAFSKGEGMPDYAQLTVDEEGEVAVIPGSSLAGAFRSQIAKIVKRLAHLQSWEEAQEKLDSLFGTWVNGKSKEENLHASKIIFDEIVVNGGHELPITRNAIDRFTGGAVDGALYEAMPWTGGTVLLRISWKQSIELDSVISGMLLWAIRDLQSGILPIGGETAVGRGIFCKPEKGEAEIRLDGSILDEEREKEYMQSAALWCKKGRDANAGR